MHSTSARKIAWTPPPALTDPPAERETEPDIEEEIAGVQLAELELAGECEMGCDWPDDGPLSPEGSRW